MKKKLLSAAETAKALNVKEKTIYRYVKLGCPLAEKGPPVKFELAPLQKWLFENGYTTAKGRTPYRLHGTPLTTPQAPNPTPKKEEVEEGRQSVEAEIKASQNPLATATLLQRTEAAAFKQAQRRILEGKWVEREKIEKQETEQAVALRRRLLALAERLAARGGGDRTVIEEEVRAILDGWVASGRIEEET